MDNSKIMYFGIMLGMIMLTIGLMFICSVQKEKTEDENTYMPDDMAIEYTTSSFYQDNCDTNYNYISNARKTLDLGKFPGYEFYKQLGQVVNERYAKLGVSGEEIVIRKAWKDGTIGYLELNSIESDVVIIIKYDYYDEKFLNIIA